LTRLVCMWSFMLQPTTCRLNRSMTPAKYTHHPYRLHDYQHGPLHDSIPVVSGYPTA
jgi:hypothetical protein